ncbi:hypothetical protein BY996DRAFT_3472615 [Phakopsora pachyrhizi]|nr:hypothetical protein BY996DRAFT_3472615 [Phakopsora pachyrhizi]
MLKKHLCIFIVHFFFPFSKPSPSILVESGGATALGDKFIKIETSVKEIRTPISKIPFIEQQVINDKIFGARNIAIYADFHVGSNFFYGSFSFFFRNFLNYSQRHLHRAELHNKKTLLKSLRELEHFVRY